MSVVSATFPEWALQRLSLGSFRIAQKRTSKLESTLNCSDLLSSPQILLISPAFFYYMGLSLDIEPLSTNPPCIGAVLCLLTEP